MILTTTVIFLKFGQICNLLLWISMWTLWAFSLKIRRP